MVGWKAVTSDDVIATWDLRMDETILSPSEQITYGKFERPTAESKYIVSVRANSISWRNFLYFATMALHPNHILKDLDGTAFLDEYAFSVIPGTGPYIIKEEKLEIKNHIPLIEGKITGLLRVLLTGTSIILIKLKFQQ